MLCLAACYAEHSISRAERLLSKNNNASVYDSFVQLIMRKRNQNADADDQKPNVVWPPLSSLADATTEYISQFGDIKLGVSNCVELVLTLNLHQG